MLQAGLDPNFAFTKGKRQPIFSFFFFFSYLATRLTALAACVKVQHSQQAAETRVYF